MLSCIIGTLSVGSSIDNLLIKANYSRKTSVHMGSYNSLTIKGYAI